MLCRSCDTPSPQPLFASLTFISFQSLSSKCRQRSGRIQGGLARIARIRYAEEASAYQSTSEPIYDIEYILGGKVSNVDRNGLEYTTATAEGLIDTDDGTRGLRRKRTKRGEENVTTKQK